jgi:hypothetical protein
MKLTLFFEKTVAQNAQYYFDASKKLKSKLSGMEFIIDKTKKEIEHFEKEFKEKEKKHQERKKIEQFLPKYWYDSFRHCFTRDGHLCVFGKDSGTNEVLLKKHVTTKDIVLHTSAPGSPFGIIKDCVNEHGECTLDSENILDAAVMICAFSSQWKRGFGTADAFWVYPHQVSKKAESGEYIAKGAFMIRGKKNELKNIVLQIGLGVEKKIISMTNKNDDDTIIEDKEETETIEIHSLISGSPEVIKKRCGNNYLLVEPGQFKYKSLVKDIKKKLKAPLDNLPNILPNGCRILKRK